MSMEFSNRIVPDIQGLYQWPTYSGMLEGIPSEEMNKRIIDGVIEVAKELTHWDQVYLIDPKIVIRENHESHSLEEFVKLPRIACVAKLLGPEIDKQCMFSSLTLVWFQDEYAMPVDKDIAKQVEELDWFGLAIDFDL